MSSYAVLADLPKYGVSAVALAPIDPAVQQAAIDAASAVVDSFLRARYKLPLSAWGVDITRTTAVLAVYDLLVTRGYNPAAGADINIKLRHDDAMLWLLHVSRQDVHPDVTPTQDQAPGYDAPRVLTNSQRGWNDTGSRQGKVFG